MSLRPNPFAHLAKNKTAPKAGAAEGNQTDLDDEADPRASQARARERSRILAILTSEPAKADPVLACHMALDGPTPRNQAINAMAGMLGMDPGVKPAAASPAAATAAAIIAAGRKRRGEV